jgi:hypothetical protein
VYCVLSFFATCSDFLRVVLCHSTIPNREDSNARHLLSDNYIYIHTHTRRAETCIGLEKMLGALENESDAYAEAIKTHYSEYLYTLWSWRYGCEKGVVVESGARPR